MDVELRVRAGLLVMDLINSLNELDATGDDSCYDRVVDITEKIKVVADEMNFHHKETD